MSTPKPLTRDDLQDIHKWMLETEQTLKVILCCSLLPKDGANWAYYESLFSSAEKMVAKPGSSLESPTLPMMVRDILLDNHKQTKE